MKEQDAAHSFSEGSELPSDNETVEDGGGCYVAGSREDEILAQQNAFHLVKALDLIDECYHYLKANPPDKTKMTYNKWQSLVEETDYMREFNADADYVRHKEAMKEQDAAHSFDKRVDAICEVCKFNDAIHYDNNKYFCCGCFAKELTRLRSELQDTKDYYEKAQKHLIDEHFSELQQKDEVIKELTDELLELRRFDER